MGECRPVFSCELSWCWAMTHVTYVMIVLYVTRQPGARTDLALGVEELDASPRLGMCYGVVFSLFIIAHGIETSWW